MSKQKYQMVQIKENFFIRTYRKIARAIAKKLDGHDIIEAHWNISVVDKNGKIKHQKRIKAQSYVAAMIDLIYANMMNGTGSDTSIPDITNTSRTFDISDYSGTSSTPAIQLGMGLTNNSRGIVIGDSNQAVDISDYALINRLTAGIDYGTMDSTTAPTTDTSKRFFKVKRSFTNNSGASITIREIGLYALTRYDTSQGDATFCIERSVIGDTVVADTDSILVEYEIKVEI